MRVVVVGAGINGLACARRLARRGAEVLVCERETVGSGSTPRSVGGIRTQFSTPQNVELSKHSIRAWERLAETSSVDLDYRRPGYLFLAREPGTAETFEANVAMQNDRGAPSRLLDPAEAVEHCPGLDPAPFRAATYAPVDGFADPARALQAMRAAAEAEDARVRERAPVTDVLREGGEVVGVEVEGERVEAGAVVNAAGPWLARVAAMADVALPVAPRRRQILEVAPKPRVPEDVPLTIDLDGGSHFRPSRGGRAYVGGHVGDTDPDQDPDDYDEGVDRDWADTVLELTSAYTSYFDPGTEVVDGWSGLYAVTPDHQPIVDEVAPGFVVAGGFSGHGFQHAPATGRLVAEIVLEGEASLVDADIFAADRFEAGEGTPEANVA